jgi:adenylate cyclase
MKRCPECRRDYYDDSLLYCLEDGVALIQGSVASPDDPPTAILHETAAPSEGATRAQIFTADQTAVFPSDTAEVPPPKSFDKRLLLAPIALAVIALGGLSGYRYFNAADTEQINSIAVLPFENRSGNSDTDYLSDGLAESLIYRLSQLPNLKVSPANSVFRYKGKNNDVKSIAAEMGVTAVMVGRMSQRGDDLNISVELIDAANNKTLWGEQYDRKSSDLLATQREIAAAIVQKLQLKLSGSDAKGLTKNYTDSNEAYQHYLRGRFYWNKRNAENMRKAIEQFQAAADKDPNYALAYVGLADCYVLSPFYGETKSQDVLTNARAYANRALEIDPSLGEAHASLAYTNYMLWNFAEAEPGFKRAIELNPNYATGHKWYGNFLEDSRRLEESLQQLKKAQELEPLSLIVGENLAEQYLLVGDLNSASAQCTRVMEIDPDHSGIRRALSLIHLKQGRKGEALAEAQKGVELSNRMSLLLANLGFVHAQTGDRNEALKVIKELEDLYSQKRANGSDVAIVYAGLGDKDSAFAWLEKDFKDRVSTLAAWVGFIHFESLQSDPRMVDLRRRMGLPPY